jgi:hypothetical protein
MFTQTHTHKHTHKHTHAWPLQTHTHKHTHKHTHAGILIIPPAKIRTPYTNTYTCGLLGFWPIHCMQLAYSAHFQDCPKPYIRTEKYLRCAYDILSRHVAVYTHSYVIGTYTDSSGRLHFFCRVGDCGHIPV